MNRFKNSVMAVTLAAGLGMSSSAWAQDDTITFGFIQDFTAVYTFATGEYNQGQQDYLTMINELGGIEGVRFEALVRDHGNEPQRGIEAYNRGKEEGAILFDFLSTPVGRALVRDVMDDEIVMISPLTGRGDASDGETFPWIFPMMPTYWSQAAVLIDYIKNNEDGLEGKQIALVHIDSPYGREPIPVMQDLAEAENFEFQTFAYPSPGNEQSATWSEVRRFQPDHVFIWGAGGSQSVSVREAIRNGFAPEDIYSVVWLAETDAENVGADIMTGVRRFEAVAPGTDHAVIERIQETVIDSNLGAGDAENVGSTYYNIGVATMAVTVEAARLALEAEGAPLTPATLKAGFESLENFDAEGMMPPLTITEQDHQGGGAGRVSQWNGEAWEPVSDWGAAYQDIVQVEIDQGAEEFLQGN